MSSDCETSLRRTVKRPLSSSIAVYQPQAELSGGKFDGKFGVR